MRVMRGLVAGVLASLALAIPAVAEEVVPPSQSWSFSGVFGTYDRAATQRGLQVYREVCASCHGLRRVAYRNLADIGYDEDEIKAIAADYEVTDGPDDEGEMFQRPARPADRMISPFANDNAARAANGGALPPDLSLMVKARKHGPDYLYGLLVGYRDEAPEDFWVDSEGEPIAADDRVWPEGMNYNDLFRGHQIAMPPPLGEDAVEYADGTAASPEQMARDVTIFLAWAAEPEMEVRKSMGVKVILFLIVFTGLLYAVKRKVWADVH